jgi:nitrite reductase/ring-hydroxylating ferredoxin subunit/uncharacterized membrane protein
VFSAAFAVYKSSGILFEAALLKQDMKSKASIKSHPLHPILILFPIAFFTGTLVAHIAGWLMQKSELLYTATLLNWGGVVMAIVAAIPGFIDYLYTVPPNSSGKKRAAQHGILNTSALVLFIVALWLRQRDDTQFSVVLAFEIAGVVLMMVAGWMGGTLVHRNQISIDQRYANAGKWNEAYFTTTAATLEVAKQDELKVNAMKLLHVNGKRIVLARTEKGFAAFDDRCTHRGGSLAGGSLACDTVQCPWHGSQFSVDDGRVKAGPAKEGIKTYKIAEDNGAVFLTL